VLAVHSKLTAGHEFDRPKKGFAKVTFPLLRLQHPGPFLYHHKVFFVSHSEFFHLGRGEGGECLMTTKKEDQTVANCFEEEGKKFRGREYSILQRTVACKESCMILGPKKSIFRVSVLAMAMKWMDRSAGLGAWSQKPSWTGT
jgi:hypothetical protein